MPKHHGYPAPRARPAAPRIPAPNFLEATEAGERFVDSGRVAAGAALFATVQLRNPPESSVDVIIEQLVLTSSVADELRVGYTNDVAASLSGGWLSADEVHRPGVAEIRTEADGPSVDEEILNVRVPANDARVVPNLGITLRSGEILMVQASTVQTVLAVTFIGRERPWR